MLILRHPKLNHVWQQRITCYCHAELLVTIGDVETRDAEHYWLPEYYVKCPICKVCHGAKLLTSRDRNIINFPALASEKSCHSMNASSPEHAPDVETLTPQPLLGV
jgi:hypothetical protein